MRMLYPDAVADIDPADVYADLPVRRDRPSVRLNMIVSVDGGTSWGGVSGALGGGADKALFSVLRSFADVVFVAAGTVRAEHYGPAVLPPEVQKERDARGQSPVPRIAVVSRRCELDWSTQFFTAAAERPLVITVDASPAGNRARAEEVAEVVIAGEHDVDMARAIAELGARGARQVLAEGGPTLNGELARVRLLDEVCVTLSPRLASGDAKRIIAGSTLDELERLELRSICEADAFLFLRYRPLPG